LLVPTKADELKFELLVRSRARPDGMRVVQYHLDQFAGVYARVRGRVRCTPLLGFGQDRIVLAVKARLDPTGGEYRFALTLGLTSGSAANSTRSAIAEMLKTCRA